MKGKKMPEEKKGLPKLVAEAIEAGKVVFYGEFRKGNAEEFEGRGGKKFKKSTMIVETVTDVLHVTEFLPDNTDIAAWKPPFQKGQMVVGVCSGLETNSGARVANAKLQAVV